MTYTIAMAGKGGTGKTTVCGLFIDYLAKAGKGPILAVDADANSNLNEVLGIKPALTLGDIREDLAHADIAENSPIPPSMTKKEYADFKFSSALVEEECYDFLAMGRTQGKGCYCYVNDVLREQIQKYYKNYKYLIVDNEAGLEHISRGILPPVDQILLVSDCSRRGIQAAGRIAEMIRQLDLKVKAMRLIVNRAPGGALSDGISEEIVAQKLTLAGVIPQDELVYEYDSAGKPLVALPESSAVKRALAGIIQKLELPA
ncbi:AAA family ATPase [Treponema endosymbiont of Eucomonympha sp.]|uniref:ATP-binding protein n=2 Tax=Treponema endosymbiont of Eucomonympha sp. TaxID=1580831 RepID=UPI0007838AB6|nr:AAA family ATPase [Treponema endosymbiont of Eucomonympha sp.]